MGNAGKLKTRRITCDTFIRYNKIFNLRKEASYVLLPREQKVMSRIWRRHLFSWMRETPLKSGAICSCDKGQKTISFCLWQLFVFYLRGFLTTMTSRLDVASARWNLDQWCWSKLYAFVKKNREEMFSSACSCNSGMLEPFASGEHQQICCTVQYNRAALQYLLRLTLEHRFTMAAYGGFRETPNFRFIRPDLLLPKNS